MSEYKALCSRLQDRIKELECSITSLLERVRKKEKENETLSENLRVMQAAYDKLSDEYNELTMDNIHNIFKYLNMKVKLEELREEYDRERS